MHMSSTDFFFHFFFFIKESHGLFKVYLWRDEIVIENLWTVTFNLWAREQVVTVTHGQKLVIRKMKNIKKRVQENNFKAKI